MRSFLAGFFAALLGLRDTLSSRATRVAYIRLILALMAAWLFLFILGIVGLQFFLPGWLPEWFTQGLPSWLQNSPPELPVINAPPNLSPSASASSDPGIFSAIAAKWSQFSAWSAELGSTVLRWTVGLLLVLLLFFVTPVVAFALVNALFPAFNDAIYMSALAEVNPELYDELAASPGRSLAINLLFSLRRLAIYLALSLLIALIGFIPAIGSASAFVLQLWLTAHNLSWELLDPYFDRRQMNWQQQRVFLRNHRAQRLGFATPSAGLLAIPFVGMAFFGFAQASMARFTIKDDIRATR